MKNYQIIKSVSYAVTFSTIFATANAFAATEIEYPAQQPLSLIEGISPNVLFTIDDSGSMAWAFTPDAIYGNSNTKRSRSSFFNAQYYNPDVVYKVPKKITLVSGEVRVEDYPVPSFTDAPTNGFSGTDRVDLSRNYVAQWYYDGYSNGWLGCRENCQSGSVRRGWYDYSRSRAYYYEYTCTNSNSKNTENCYTHRFVQGNQQERNFAIWYSFYRNRLLATKSAASLAFYKMPESMRFTWGSINACHIGNTRSTDCANNGFGLFKDRHKVNFYTWLDALGWTGSTPSHAAMKRAGDLMKKTTSYTLDPSGKPYSCQANYHVFMTDGMWNQRPAVNTLPGGDADNISINNSYITYDPEKDYARPYADSNSHTLADLAFHYWSTDLLPGTDNKIQPRIAAPNDNKELEFWDPRNNPATWQHMVNYIVGLALSNSLTNTSAPTWNGNHPAPTFANLNELKKLGTTNGKNWPVVSNDNSNNVYDLWHAAINSRGEFFSTDTPDSLVAAFETILLTIGSGSNVGSSPAVNSSVGEEGTSYSFQTTYAADMGWAGNLAAYKSVVKQNGEITKQKIWDADELLKAKGYASRNILMADGSSSQTSLKKFQWSNLSNAQKTQLNRDPDLGDNKDNYGEQRVNFVRGDRSQEGKIFRERKSVLGDIIHSKPATYRGARYLTNYANRIEGNSSKYQDFYSQQKNVTPMVYVGGNDGMLHAFNADTGEEVFAFVPSAVFTNLHKLSARSYGSANHQYYVDGSPIIADVFIDNKWRSVLVGTLGAGGKGIYALDITDVGKANGGPKLLWEFGEDDLAAYSAKLGYTFAKPTIARLHNGKWAVVTGNGYSATGSTNGKAAMLIIDMETGSLTKSLEVNGDTGIANGLSTPRLQDVNGDGIADFAYAGDLQGNLWRFDLAPNNNDTANPFMRKVQPRQGEAVEFQVSFGGSPFYVAKMQNGGRQSVTSPPAIVRHPSNLGYLIVFGTGKYYTEGDKNGSPDLTNTVYGIWDPTTKVARSVNKSGFPYANINRSHLQKQTMQSALHEVDSGADARLHSKEDVAWAEAPKTGISWSTSSGGKSLKAGWYFDLALNREMIIEDMHHFGRTLIFQSLVPNLDPCSSGIDNWTYAINPTTGGQTDHNVFTDHNSKDSSNRQVITALKMDGEGGITIAQKPDNSFEICTGAGCEDAAPDPTSIGRQSWRTVEEE